MCSRVACLFPPCSTHTHTQPNPLCKQVRQLAPDDVVSILWTDRYGKQVRSFEAGSMEERFWGGRTPKSKTDSIDGRLNDLPKLNQTNPDREAQAEEGAGPARARPGDGGGKLLSTIWLVGR